MQKLAQIKSIHEHCRNVYLDKGKVRKAQLLDTKNVRMECKLINNLILFVENLWKNEIDYEDKKTLQDPRDIQASLALMEKNV